MTSGQEADVLVLLIHEGACEPDQIESLYNHWASL
jgi:hypothetical protein